MYAQLALRVLTGACSARTGLQLLDQVLLVAAVIRLTNDLLCREVSVVRHVEEVPKVRAEGALSPVLPR